MADTVQLDPKSIQTLANALKTKETSSGFISNPGSIGNLATTALSGLSKSAEGLKTQIVSNIDTWRNLSKVGANFSNDVIGMSVAATEARMSLENFAGLIERNAKSFAGLGGSVTRGVEAFSKVAKEFQDTDIARQMMQLGYTSTEANELLALQVGFMRTKFSLDKESQHQQFEAIQKLNNEMDLLTKVTGQTRQEQESLLKKAKDDAAIEAKFKLIGIREGADAEKKAREKFAQEYSAAAARGQGEVFKDFFLTGSVRSKEAAVQMAAGGQAAIETSKAATALAKGNTELAAEYNKAANASMVAMQKNTAYLEMVTRSGSEIGGAVSDAAGKLAKVNEPLVDSVTKVAEANGILLKSQQDYAKALDIIRKDAIESQQGFKKNEKTGQYEDQAKATRALIDSEKLAKDIAAAGAGAMRDVFKGPVDNFGDKVSGAIQGLRDSVSEGNIRGAVESEVRKGLETAGKEGGAIGKVASAANQAANSVSNGLGGLLDGIKDLFSKGNAKVEVTNFPKGPTEVTGNVTVDGVRQKAIGGAVGEKGPELILAGEAGPEYVLNDQLGEKFVKSAISKIPKPEFDIKAFKESVTGTIQKQLGDIKFDQPAPQQKGGINLNEISKTISTSISSVVTSGGGSKTTKISGDTEETEKITKELEDLWKKFGEDWQNRKEVLIEGMALEDRKFSKVQAAMKADETAQKIREEYEAKRTELEDKLFKARFKEIEISEEAIETTRDAIEEQFDIISSGFLDMSTDIEDSLGDIFDFTEEGLAKVDTIPAEEKKAEPAAPNTAKENFRKSEIQQQNAQDTTPKKIPSISEMIQGMAKSSGIKDVNKIQTGQKIKLPDGTDYVVKQGDNLTKIAQQAMKDMQSKVAAPTDKATNKTQQATAEAGKVVDKKAEDQKQKDAGKAKPQDQAGSAQPAAGQKAATLDDVVKSLDMLNKMMGQLISVNENIGKQQIKALKSNSSNIYERY